MEEHLYAFERFNPRWVMRRQESVKLGMLELESSGRQRRRGEQDVSGNKMRISRIESPGG